jgi:hypothetical protein
LRGSCRVERNALAEVVHARKVELSIGMTLIRCSVIQVMRYNPKV